MEKGKVYWITGLPGSGKTTLGTALYYELKREHNNLVLLDGDILKHFVGDSLGYGKEDRVSRAKKYSNICKLLSDQGLVVIICTVAMYEEVRQWNKENIDGYVEIFINTPFEVLKKRDKNGLYTCNEEFIKQLSNMEFPSNPNIEFGRDGDFDVAEAVGIIQRVLPDRETEYDRDRNYWNSVYMGKTISEQPSDFAKAIINDVKMRGGNLLDLGCGNGRDSFFFHGNGLRVTGVDASDQVICRLLNQITTDKMDNIYFVCDDFVRCKALYQIKYDTIYSRFTLHAIEERQEDELLRNIIDSLKDSGRFCVEARTVKDDLYGKGKKVGENAYIYNDHFRRFIDKDILRKKMVRMGFEIISIEESRGFSKTETEDPVLMRLVAGRKM